MASDESRRSIKASSAERSTAGSAHATATPPQSTAKSDGHQTRRCKQVASTPVDNEQLTSHPPQSLPYQFYDRQWLRMHAFPAAKVYWDLFGKRLIISVTTWTKNLCPHGAAMNKFDTKFVPLPPCCVVKLIVPSFTVYSPSVTGEGYLSLSQ